MKAFVSLAVIVALAVACLPPAGTLFKTTIVLPDGSSPMPVALGDQTGLVTAIEPTERDVTAPWELTVKADPDDPKALILTWLGGMCDDDVAIAFARTEGGFGLYLDTKVAWGACMGAGVFRGIRIRLSEPVSPETIVVTEKR